MKYVERRSLGEIEETCDGGMKRSRMPLEENKTQYKRIRNQTRKIVDRAMRMEAN